MADELKPLPSKRITCSGRKSDGSACPANIEGPHEHDARYAELMGIIPADSEKSK